MSKSTLAFFSLAFAPLVAFCEDDAFVLFVSWWELYFLPLLHLVVETQSLMARLLRQFPFLLPHPSIIHWKVVQTNSWFPYPNILVVWIERHSCWPWPLPVRRNSENNITTSMMHAIYRARVKKKLTAPMVLRNSVRCFRLILERIDFPIVSCGSLWWKLVYWFPTMATTRSSQQQRRHSVVTGRTRSDRSISRDRRRKFEWLTASHKTVAGQILIFLRSVRPNRLKLKQCTFMTPIPFLLLLMQYSSLST